VELAANRPLPPYQLSAEALQRREERLAATILRDNKIKKKVAPVVPARKGMPPSANSVAAKRLAAKRGQPFDQAHEDLFEAGPSSCEQPRSSFSAAPAAVAFSSFDPFDDAPATAPALIASSTSAPVQTDLSHHPQLPQRKASAAATLDSGVGVDKPGTVRRPSFEANNQPSQVATGFGQGFDAFGQDSEDETGFDPFASTAVPSTAAVGILDFGDGECHPALHWYMLPPD
jgi:hypothetical protein